MTHAGGDNVGVLVDTLHFSRSSSTLAELRAMPPNLLPFAHICDAAAAPPKSTEEMLFTARSERLPPGLGGLGVADGGVCGPVVCTLACPFGFERPPTGNGN